MSKGPRRPLLAGALLLATTGLAFAQQPVVTRPASSSTAGGNVSGTIASTGVFQMLFAAVSGGASGANVTGGGGPRHGCTILNNGTHVMEVTEGMLTPASLITLAVILQPGQPYYCSVGGSVLVGQVNITGTSGDAFYATQY